MTLQVQQHQDQVGATVLPLEANPERPIGSAPPAPWPTPALPMLAERAHLRDRRGPHPHPHGTARHARS